MEKYISSANQLNEANKHLLNKKQTGEQQSTSQTVKYQPTSQSTNHPINQPSNQPTNQPTNNPTNQTMALEEPFHLTQTRQVN